ncbi:MAG: extracellular solute-binding protein [Chloroflexi bacterium]|nr:extracellular solute-binding protein [Chloroflexota bacterium]
MDRGSISRRSLLGLVGGAVAGGLLAACGAPAASPTAAPKPAEPTKPAAAAPTTAPAAKPAEPTKPAAAAPTTAPAAAATKPAAAAPAKATGEVKVHFRNNDDAKWQDDKFIPAFNAKNPGLKVVQEVLPNQPEYFPKVAALHATGTIGDVVWASMAGYRSLALRGITRPIDDLIKADNYDLSDYIEIGMSDMRWDGKLFGMPWGSHTGAPLVVYNVDMVTKAGLKIPDDINTYEKLLAAAKKLQVVKDGKPEVYGFAPATGAATIFQWMRAFGGSPWDADAKKVTIMSPESLAGFKAWTEYYVQDLSPVPSANTNLPQLFAGARIAMTQLGYEVDFNPGKGIGDKFKWEVALMPKGPTGKLPTNFTINGITIAAKAKNPEGAWQYVRYLMDKETQLQIVMAGAGRPAARKAILDDPTLNEKLKGHKAMRPTFDIAQGWLEPANLRIEEARTVIEQLVGPVAAKEAKLDDRIKEMEQKLQQVLDKPRAE